MKSFQRSLLVFFLAGVLNAVRVSHAEGTLTLDQFLSQVREKNGAYRGWELERRAAAERERRRDLVTSPSAFANGRITRDKKLPTFPGFAYDRLDTEAYSVGVEGLTRFGLRAKLAYEMDFTDYVGVNDPFFASTPLRFWDSRPVLELTQSLWKNAGGKETRAEMDALSSEARAAGHAAEAHLRETLSEAEVAYWRLAVARSAVTVQSDALEAAEGIHDYTTRRARMNLGDESDRLQSSALLESRRLELKIARDAERSALRHFNALRNIAPEEPISELEPIDAVLARAGELPEGRRADVLAAEAEADRAVAEARRVAQGDRPTLEVFGAYALNGRDDEASSAFSDSYDANRPTASAGLRFAVPLNLSALGSARQGTLRQADAARARVEQAKADEQSDRAELTSQLVDARERLRLAELIVNAQRKKLEYERRRLRQGRTSTYQVLLFEQEFSQAELARVQAGRSLLELLARRRLYGPA